MLFPPLAPAVMSLSTKTRMGLKPKVVGEEEWWSQVLFLRLVDGKLWHMTAVRQSCPSGANDLKTTF